MERDVDQMRQEVEETSTRLAETMEALTEKKSHVGENLKEAAKERSPRRRRTPRTRPPPRSRTPRMP